MAIMHTLAMKPREHSVTRSTNSKARKRTKVRAVRSPPPERQAHRLRHMRLSSTHRGYRASTSSPILTLSRLPFPSTAFAVHLASDELST